MCVYLCKGCACVNIYDLYTCGIRVYTYIWRPEIGIKKHPHWTSILTVEVGLLGQIHSSEIMATVCSQLTLRSSFLCYGKPCPYVISLWALVSDLQSLVCYSKCFHLLLSPQTYYFFKDRFVEKIFKTLSSLINNLHYSTWKKRLILNQENTVFMICRIISHLLTQIQRISGQDGNTYYK